ncbi:mycothiol system anti-sigma-R factor [Amycolatopsis granulosa]|uniref:mycothiol system anti-sigma-R factor n=1 Tax=Amycolatopsis granulosa TaxID=185684 RepID=UPI0014237DF9|nr:mycothiol system anti-sigma-R factor [Amycolatopsis granulosa]NIH87346.1 mycothiol system anti-sigma-R factor [Amycolatopsis granulosa]
MTTGREPQKDDVRCSEALAEIFLLLDRECSPERDAQLRKHIEECPPCLEEYGIDEQLKKLLHRKCGGDTAPDEFKQKLRASIYKTVQQHGDLTVEHTQVRLEQNAE